MRQSVFPEGWDEERVRKALDDFQEQTVEVPVELVPAVRELIAKHTRRSSL